jgi:translation initiation factor RLI1
VSSYAIIRRFRRQDQEDYFSTDEDEVTVYRIRYVKYIYITLQGQSEKMLQFKMLTVT